MNTCNHDTYAQALAALDHATAAPLPTGGAVVHFPGGQPLVITAQTAETWASAAWPELGPEQITVLAARLVEIAAPVSALPRRAKPKPMTVLLDADLEQCLHAERERIGMETGIPVSLSACAVRLLRAGLAEAIRQ